MAPKADDTKKKDGEGTGDKAKKAEEEAAAEPEAVTVLQECRNNIALIEKAVTTKEPRHVYRALRTLPSLRKRLTVDDLTQLLAKHADAGPGSLQAQLCDALANVVDTAPAAAEMAVDAAPVPDAPVPLAMQPSWVQPIAPAAAADGELYLYLLGSVFLLDHDRVEDARECCNRLVDEITGAPGSKRALDALAAKVLFYYARTNELCGRDVEVRSPLLAAYRVACLHGHEETQATILNCLLRNYIAHSQYDQADILHSKATFPEGKSNNQQARYMYYVGRILSVQLDYSGANTALLQALRKAPQTAAAGFRLTVTKLMVIVQILMGEIPERSVFRSPGLEKDLQAYLEVTNAVRVGDLEQFEAARTKHGELFVADGNATLIGRLRHSVIKTGLRQINVAYSRISLADVCAKLKLECVEDTEGIVGKAIHDGVIESTIVREGGVATLVSDQGADLYSTLEPASAFHKRISYCLTLHNDAVQAMRYHPDAHKTKKPTAEDLKKRKELEEEAAALEDEEDDF